MTSKEVVKDEEVCDMCQDNGFFTKTEWSGTDDSYDVEVKCQCQED